MNNIFQPNKASHLRPKNALVQRVKGKSPDSMQFLIFRHPFIACGLREAPRLQHRQDVPLPAPLTNACDCFNPLDNLARVSPMASRRARRSCAMEFRANATASMLPNGGPSAGYWDVLHVQF